MLNREYQLTAEELKKYLEKLLPDYMVPAVYVVLDAMPLSKSGKIEYKLLEKQCYPAMEQKVEIKNAANIKQQGIAQLINTCLSVKVDDVNQDIFTLGAASLEVQRIKQILKEKFMVDITTRHIYAARTVANIEKSLRP